MTTNETKAPERTFVTWPSPNATGLAFSAQARPPAKRTEYVHIDKHRELEAENARLRAEAAAARDNALEEAAQVVEQFYQRGQVTKPDDIRALKGMGA